MNEFFFAVNYPNFRVIYMTHKFFGNDRMGVFNEFVKIKLEMNVKQVTFSHIYRHTDTFLLFREDFIANSFKTGPSAHRSVSSNWNIFVIYSSVLKI